MTPSQLKEEQHKRYDAKALASLRGELAPKVPEKARYSKSCKILTKHVVNFA